DDPVETLADTQRYSLVELLISSYRMTQHQLTGMMLKAYPPDIPIDIPRNAASTFEFDRAEELIALGRQSGIAAIRQFEADGKR
ncbi:MAG TPA: hypothetical protein VFX48_06995, partial [Saprospiraceae bacterium]|nr:hypothetical protein [Saprospiraceae bacterium]